MCRGLLRSGSCWIFNRDKRVDLRGIVVGNRTGKGAGSGERVEPVREDDTVDAIQWDEPVIRTTLNH